MGRLLYLKLIKPRDPQIKINQMDHVHLSEIYCFNHSQGQLLAPKGKEPENFAFWDLGVISGEHGDRAGRSLPLESSIECQKCGFRKGYLNLESPPSQWPECLELVQPSQNQQYISFRVK